VFLLGIGIINKLVPEKFRMNHNKAKLMEQMKNCESYNIVRNRQDLRK